MKSLFTLLTIVLAASPLHAQKHRAVRPPAPQCSFAVSTAYPDPIGDSGMVRGRIIVTPSSSNCTSWNGYSPVDWILLEPGSAANELAMTVKPNESNTLRSAIVRVAAIDLTVTQLGRPDAPVIETGLVVNGAFHKDLSSWGWQDRFPNGVGTVTWASSIDANGSPSSGSMLLRSTAIPGPGIQSLQCVAVQPGQVYEYRFATRMGPASNGLAVSSVLDLDTSDCSGPYAVRFTKQITGDASGSWQRHSATFRVAADAHSVLIVIASKTSTLAAFDVHYDDVYLKQQ